MNKSRKSHSPRLALLVAVIATVAMTPLVSVATGAHTSQRLYGFDVYADHFVPWDFVTEQYYDADHVDWPVDLIFSRNADINKVKSATNWRYPIGYNHGWTESKMYGFYNSNNRGWTWDRDAGKKSGACALSPPYWVYHYRIYAPNPPDYFGNQAWGRFVYGTTHLDYKECQGSPPDQWSGRSETAEKFMWETGTSTFGNGRSKANFVQMYNSEYRQDSGHWWENDGRATFIEVF